VNRAVRAGGNGHAGSNGHVPGAGEEGVS
jgi:hypothetical protein